MITKPEIKWQNVLIGIAALALALAGLVLPVQSLQPIEVIVPTPMPQVASRGVTGFDNLSIGGDVTAGGALSGATVGATGAATTGTWLNITKRTTVALGAGGIITPTGTYQPITSTAAVTTSATTAIVSGTVPGQLLLVTNANAANAIVVDGAGANVECGGNKTLVAGGTLFLIWNGTDWLCLPR